MKALTKYTAVLLAAAIVLCLSASCGRKNEIDPAVKEKHEEIIRNNLTIDYLSDYSELPADQNRVGISVVGGAEWDENNKCIKIAFGNSHVYQSFSDSTQLVSRCHLFDAENPDTQIETKFFTVANGSSDNASFGGAIVYSKELKSEYVLLKFDGVLASENKNWETPAVFWIIAFERDGTVTVLTDSPLMDH